MCNMVTEQHIAFLADAMGGTVETPVPGFPNTHIKLPNGAIVSIGYGPGHYCDARTGITRDIMGPGLPMKRVEVAYWHPEIAPKVIDWLADDEDGERWTEGEKGGLLPENDVHGWQTADELEKIVVEAAALIV